MSPSARSRLSTAGISDGGDAETGVERPIERPIDSWISGETVFIMHG